jgi:hypothetical protein
MKRCSLVVLSVVLAAMVFAASSALAYESVFVLAGKPLTSPRLTATGKPFRPPGSRHRSQRGPVAHAAESSFKCTEPGSWYSSANGLYISAEIGMSGNWWGMLRARATSVGPWERFQFCEYESGIYAGVWSIWSNAAERWVTAEFGYTGGEYGMLRARATGIGSWERYRFATYPGVPFGIQSNYNGLWVSAELGNPEPTYAMLRARSGTRGAWENFG